MEEIREIGVHGERVFFELGKKGKMALRKRLNNVFSIRSVSVFSSKGLGTRPTGFFILIENRFTESMEECL